MEVKENRPDACTASGTAQSIYKDFSTDAPDIQGELTGPVLPDECAADIVSFCSEQTIAYDDLLEYATLFYLQDKDPEDPPFRDTLKFELLTLTNSCIDAYNFGKRDPNAAPGAKLKDAYPDKKEGAERYKRLSGLHTLQIAVILYKLHHAVGILWNNSHDDGNFDIGVYQYSGDNEGCYDVGEQNLKSLIRGYCKTGTIKDVNETIEALRAICPRVERCRNRDLVAVNNGIYDYGNKILMAFDPAFVFTSKKHVNFVDRAQNPVIHNNEDGTDWDVVSWMNELSDDPDVVKLLWQIIGATVRPYVSWNKSAWLYSPSGNNGKGTLCTLLRNLCGAGDWTSIPLKNFGKDFMLTSLMHASVIITDENDTGTFVDDAASLKSIITGDPFQMNRKNRDPRDVLFNGFMVQCVNEIPRVRDKSESMLRRLLVIPFDKRFEGCERKYIKGDYPSRTPRHRRFFPTCPRRQSRQHSPLRISLSTCTTSTSPTFRRWRPTFRRRTSTAHARRASPSWTSAISRLSRRATTRTSSWRSCARTWTPQGASSMPPRRRATPCKARIRGFWPACTCSPRRGATPRTPCPA